MKDVEKKHPSFFRASYAHVFSLNSLIKCDHFDQRQVNKETHTHTHKATEEMWGNRNQPSLEIGAQAKEIMHNLKTHTLFHSMKRKSSQV